MEKIVKEVRDLIILIIVLLTIVLTLGLLQFSNTIDSLKSTRKELDSLKIKIENSDYTLLQDSVKSLNTELKRNKVLVTVLERSSREWYVKAHRRLQ